MTSIRFEGVKKTFGTVRALDIDSLHVESGEIVCFVGPSGCGKTTALRTIAGLLRQDEGDVRFGELLVNDLPPERRNAAMVFQNYALFPHMTVYENVAFGLTVRKFQPVEIAEKVRAALELVQLPDVGARYPRQLSGGQQQRIALARAVATEPDILLFDEPLSNLDAKLREYMRFELRALLERLAITSIYVTHDQTEAMVIGDRLVVMHGGSIVQDDAPSEIYRRPVNRFVADFIGTASFIEGTVVEHEPDTGLARLQTADGIEIWGIGVDVRKGDESVACIRPEAVAFNRGAQSELDMSVRNRILVKIDSATNLGEVTETHMFTGDWKIRARVPSWETVRVGAAAVIDLRPEHCAIVKS